MSLLNVNTLGTLTPKKGKTGRMSVRKVSKGETKKTYAKMQLRLLLVYLALKKAKQQ